jgi:photosystem II stability/assembly factor-like uncharacterized protein
MTPLPKLRFLLALFIPASVTGCTAILGDFQVEPPLDGATGPSANGGSGDAPFAPPPDAAAFASDGGPTGRGPNDATAANGGDSTVGSGPGPNDATAASGGDATMAGESGSGARLDAAQDVRGTGEAGTAVPDANSADAPAAIDTLIFTQSPSTGIAGAALSTIVVSLLAPGGVVDAKFTGKVTLALAASPPPGAAIVGGPLTSSVSSGTATFTGITISQAGTYAFSASSGAISATSPAVSISPAVGSWKPANGTIVGGDVRSIAVSPTDPNVAYAGTNGGGIYMTTTGTTNPSWAFVGLPGKGVGNLVIDPTNAKTIYAGADGVYRSNDAGATWTSLTTGLSGIYVSALAVDPVTTTTLYIGCNQGAYKTTDAGQTWTPILVSADASPLTVTAIGIAPTSPKTIYAGVDSGSIMESKDGGLTWTTLPGVFGPNPGAALWYRQIAVDLVNPAVLYVGFENPMLGQGGLWKFAGGAWSAVLGIPATGEADAIVLNPAGKTSYAALYGDSMYTSSDGGVTWTATGGSTFSNDPIAIGVAPSNSAVAYAVNYLAADGHMMHLTTNGGAAWTDAFAGIHAYDANSVVVAPSSPSIVYLGGGYNGIHRSTDGASTWTTLPTTTPPWNGDFYVGVSSKNANLLYAGNNGGGIFKYSDASSTNLGVQVQPGIRTLALAVAASDDQSVYAAAYPGTNGGAYVTANGGTTWTNPTLDTFADAIAVDPSNANIAYVGLGSAYKTTDHGATWTVLSGIGSFNAMAIDPTNTLSLYVGNGGVKHSADGGATWTTIGTGLPLGVNVSAIAIDPKTPATVYAGFETQGVWRATDGGTTWAQLGLAGWTPKVITVDPSTPTTIYVGVAAGGLYKTTTGGL